MNSCSDSFGRTRARSRPAEIPRVEARSHSKARSKQAHLLQAERLGVITSDAHNAEKRDSLTPLDLVENEMRRVRCDETKVRSCTHQHLHTGGKIVGQLAEPPSIKQRDPLINIEAVDDHLRISPIRLDGAKAPNDGSIIVNRRFRPKPADHP